MIEWVLALLLLLTQATGIDRPVSPVLENLARVRVIEIQSSFEHRALSELGSWSWGEVIAWNSGYPNPIAQAVRQWQASPEHWAILSDPFYQQIGCAVATSDGGWYFVCLLGTGPADSASSAPAPTPAPITTIPNTAMVSR